MHVFIDDSFLCTGGPVLQTELNNMSIQEDDIGKAFIYSAECLPCSHVIIAISPNADEENEEDLLQVALSSSLKCAERVHSKSIALTAIGRCNGSLSCNHLCQLLVDTLVRYFEMHPSSCIEMIVFVDVSISACHYLRKAMQNHPEFVDPGEKSFTKNLCLCFAHKMPLGY